MWGACSLCTLLLKLLQARQSCAANSKYICPLALCPSPNLLSLFLKTPFRRKKSIVLVELADLLVTCLRTALLKYSLVLWTQRDRWSLGYYLVQSKHLKSTKFQVLVGNGKCCFQKCHLTFRRLTGIDFLCELGSWVSESLLETWVGHLFHLGFAVPSEAMHKYFDDYSL